MKIKLLLSMIVFHCSLLALSLLAVSLSNPSKGSLLYAQWSSDPNVNLQVSTWGQYPVACTDGEGGVYIRWEQNSYTTDQYIQHVNKYGYIRWATPVEVYGTQNGTVFEGKICPDDSNGVIVLFTEWNVIGGDPQYFTHKRVRVNRLDSNGNKLWGEYGVRVSMRDTSQALREIVTDGQKGCIVAFLVAPDSLYVQRISSTGQRMWGEEGIFVKKLIISNDVITVKNNEGGVIMQYWDGINRIHRIDQNGATLWNNITTIGYSLIKADGRGGALMSINRYNFGENRILVNRITSNGTFLWGDYGVTVDDSVGSSAIVSDIILDDSNNVIFVWQKIISGIYPDVYTQKIMPDSTLVWPDNFKISLSPNYSAGCRIVKSDSNSVIYIWSYGSGLSTQKINTIGSRLWDSNDLDVSNHDLTAHLNVLSDMNYGAIAIWDEAPLNGIYCQQIDKDGLLGNVISVNEKNNHNPTKFTLFQNYPNPFNPSTQIQFELATNSNAELTIYNILGQKIRTLMSGYQSAGMKTVTWDGKSDQGMMVTSGVYIYRLNTSHGTQMKKMLLIK